MELFISTHAIERYQERVANIPAESVRQALSSHAVMTAAKFGAPYVRIGTGQRVVLEGHHVVTVLPKGHCAGSMDRRRVYGRGR